MSHFKFELVLYCSDSEIIEKGSDPWIAMAQFLDEKDANDVLRFFAERDREEIGNYMVRPVREDLQ